MAERDKPSRRTAERKRTEVAEQERSGESMSPRESAEMAGQTFDKAVDDLTALAAADQPLQPLGVGETAADSSVTDELSGGGVAFGEFVKSVGLAVAAAQTELDKTLVSTAKELSNTSIDTVAVFEQQIKDDDGTMDKGTVHIQKLPLTNYLMPTAYNWRRVFLEANMNVQEFNARSGFNIQQKSFSADARIRGSYGMLGGSISGSAGFAYGQSSSNVDASVSTDVAAGTLHMEATLEPRDDVALPRPFVLQKGPTLQLLVGARKAIHQDNDETKPVIGQKVDLTAHLKKTDGSDNSGKDLSISISEPLLTYETTASKTDANGEVKLTVKREGAAFDPTTPLKAIVRVSFGLVTSSVGISL